MQLALTIELIFFCLLLLLIIAVGIDLIKHRIPNLLSFCIMSLGISFLCITDGWGGAIYSIGGLFTGLVLFIPFYLAGGMGAGDVKLMAALGTFLAPYNTLVAAVLTLIAGGILAVAFLLLRSLFLIRKGQVISTLNDYITTFKLFIYTRQLSVLKVSYKNKPTTRFPYALAVAIGSLLVLNEQSLLNFYHLKSLLKGAIS